MKYLPILLIIMMTGCVTQAPAGNLSPTKLRCEYLVNPQGIDISNPRLSWILKSETRGQNQTAYQILVASSLETLAKDKGDLWDSGKVKSDQSTQLSYTGKPLPSRQSCFWKVKVWQSDKTESSWSTPAQWTMGLLKPNDWKAKWISMTPNNDLPENNTIELSLDGAKWIWFPKDKPQGKHGKRYFTTSFMVSRSVMAKSATMTITADDNFTVYFNGKKAGQTLNRTDAWKKPLSIDLAKHLKLGENKIMIEAENQGGFAGLIAKFKLDSKIGGREIVTDKGWKASDNKNKPQKEWVAAKVLGAHGIKPWGKITGGIKKETEGELTSRNSPMLRKVFNIKKPVQEAQVSICGLGYYEIFLNGSKVGDHVLDPSWTSYHKNALYVTYDISKELKKEENALGIQLANGVYNQEFGDAWMFHEAPWRAFPQMLLQLDITYTDGTKDQLVSDQSWKVSTGPIYWDQLRMGVMYDARKEQPGWSTANFDDSKWKPAIIREGITGKLAAQMCEPIKVMQTLEPKSITKKGDDYEVDFGQNIAGWTRLKVSGKAGTKITLDHGTHGLVRGKPLQTEVYTLKGQPSSPTATPGQEYLEVWEPTFTYHGFSKVKVSGFPGTPDKSNFDARVVYSSFEDIGAFECSNPLLNKIVEMTRWSYKGNFVGIPTDCPHREKNGWTGDAQLVAELGMLYFGSEAVYTRWILDYSSIMAPDGKLPCISPDGGNGWGTRFLDGPAWESAYLIIPWFIYQYRGDTRILENHYEKYKHWFSWYRDENKIINKKRFERSGGKFSKYKNPQKVNQDGIIYYGIGDWPPNGKTPFEITSTAHYYLSAQIISRIAGLLGKKDEQKEYAQVAARVKNSFNKYLYDEETGTFSQGSHTGMSIALYLGLVHEKNRQRVADNLAKGIRENGYSVDIGCIGTRTLLRALADNGHLDVVYKIITKETSPGWGFQAASGRTTLAERMDGGGSDNHVFTGDVTAWMMNYLAGIRPDPENPGFQKFIIKPEPIGDLTWVKAHHDSPYGKINSAWKKDGDKLTLDITVPFNSVAEVYIPASNADSVTESGNPAKKADGVKFLRTENGKAVYEVGSGTYQFTSTLVL